MALYYSYNSLMYTLLFPAFVLPFILSSPVPNSPYSTFISFLSKNNCSMPNELKLPFPNSTNRSSFNYLSTPLVQCQTTEAFKDYSEANMLCTEVFDVLTNITCVKYNKSLSSIESDHLSIDVCSDFKSLKDIVPQKANYLSGKLSDDIICKVLCTAEKFEPLCKTLFWSYDTLMKIKYALVSDEQGNTNGNNTKVVLNIANPSVMPSSLNIESEQKSQSMKKTEDLKNIDNLPNNEGVLLVSNPNPSQIDQEPHIPKITDDLGVATYEVVSNKISSDGKIHDEVIKTDILKNMTTESLQNKTEVQSQKSNSEISESNIKIIVSENLPNLNEQSEHTDENQNEIRIDESHSKKEISDSDPQANLEENNLTSNVIEIKGGQNNRNASVNNMPNNEPIKNDAKSTGRPEESLTSVNGNDNEVKNNFPEEDNKSKMKQVDLKNQETTEIEKLKETDDESTNDVLPDNDSKLPEFSTQSAIPYEDIEPPEDKDGDQYNGIENGEEYPKSDDESLLNLPSKNKESEVKNSIVVSSNQMMNGYDNISPKNSIAQMTEEMGVSYPDQEDTHFFFYFLSIVLIIMAGYLIFHNKQKIIALIVEGRHERRRRSHGAGYKKLETK